mgnify:CR=1 FL=1
MSRGLVADRRSYRLATGELVIDESLLRKYLWDKRVTDEGCAWLTAAAQKTGTLGIRKYFEPDTTDPNDGLQQVWCLTDRGVDKAHVRVAAADGGVDFYEGEQGEERLVRQRWPDGQVQFYQGEKGSERVVRAKY